MIGIEDCLRRESKSLHGYLRESTEYMFQAALKETVIAEEDNLQDYERRRRKGGTGRRKPFMESLPNKYQVKLERSLGDGSGMDP